MMKKSTLTCDRQPKYFYFRKGRWVYYPNTKPRKEITLRHKGELLRENTPCSILYSLHDELINTPSDTLSWLIAKYFKSSQFGLLKSQDSYHGYAKHIEQTKLKNGKLFGDVRYEAISRGIIRKYLDGRTAKVSANREIQFLSSVFSWAYEREICTQNPCKGVKLNSEKARTRLVTEKEYDTVYNIALKMGSIFAPAMEIAFLCRARRDEIFSLQKKDLRSDGVFINRTKGSIPEITLWNDRLRKAIALTKTNYPNVLSPYLIHDKKGRKYSKNALDSAWQRVIKKSLDSGLFEKFTFHDLKSYGVTNHPEHHSGHKSSKAKAVYLRGTDHVKPTAN